MADDKRDAFVIRLQSKHTGEQTFLGAKYSSREAAERAAAVNVCPRCQSWSVVGIPADWTWLNRHEGFVSQGDRRR